MRIAPVLLLSIALPVTVLAHRPAYGAEAQPIRVAQAEDKVGAARQSLEQAQAALDNAESTGGDIRAARRAVANAMKSLRAAEIAAGAAKPSADAAKPVAPAAQPAAPATPAPPATAIAPAAKSAEVQNPTAPAAPAATPPTDTPKPYQPPKVETPAPKASESKASESKGTGSKTAGPKTTEPKASKVAPGSVETRPAPSTAARGNGQFERIYARPNGYRILEVTDGSGRLIRRIEIAPNGNETVLIDNARPGRPPPAAAGRPVYADPREVPPPPGADGGAYYADPRQVPPPPGYAGPPGRGYDLNGDTASVGEIERALRPGPAVGGPRGYSLNEIRRDEQVRSMVRGVDLDTITFETGSARVPDDQVRKLRRIGEALGRVLDRWPDQVFLIEGHTDAVGSAGANLALSDRRAGSIAGILTRYFGIPRQNLVAQGYGEAYLKIPTDGPERQNRRVTIRNITPLMSRR